MHEIRMGLIGFGSWPQQAYAPLLREISDVRVAWVAANSEKTLNLARKTFGDGIVTTCDYRQLIDASDVDALMIALPNALHGEVLQAAAESSKHIFFEPPVAPDPEPAKQVLEALRQCTGIVQAHVCFQKLQLTKQDQQVSQNSTSLWLWIGRHKHNNA